MRGFGSTFYFLFEVERTSFFASVLLHGAALILLVTVGTASLATSHATHSYGVMVYQPHVQPPVHRRPAAPMHLPRRLRAFEAPLTVRASLPSPPLLDAPPQPNLIQSTKSPSIPIVSPPVVVPPIQQQIPAGAFQAKAIVTPNARLHAPIGSAGFSSTAVTANESSPRRTIDGAFGSMTTNRAGPVHQTQGSSGFDGVPQATVRAQDSLAVKAGGFGVIVSGPAAPVVKSNPSAGSFRPVEILDKPAPSYTEEARRLGVEGEVVFEAVFAASGRLRVLRTMKTLGHGLDETALRAAEAIRFRPALHNGDPVDFTAAVHIVFQLAN